MATISRDRIQIIHETEVSAGEDIQETIVPNGEVWQIKRITFADVSLNNNNAGLFKVDFGTPLVRDVLAVAYLTGNTKIVSIDRTFKGDGTKVFRLIRESQSNPSKKMLIYMERFKRIGDII